MDNLNVYEEERPWGKFRRFTENSTSTVKIITIKPNEELSLQSHDSRAEFWHVISGRGIWNLDGKEHNLETGSEIFIPKKAKHRLLAGSAGIEVLEISIGQFSEEDIERYEDKYGRA